MLELALLFFAYLYALGWLLGKADVRDEVPAPPLRLLLSPPPR